MSQTTSQKRYTPAAITFIVAQVVLISTVVALPLIRSAKLQRETRLPEFHNAPREIRPTYNDPRVVTDDQLAMVLHKLRPQLRQEKPKINYVDHALRFWGADAEFKDQQCLSGQEMRQMLLDHRSFSSFWGDDAKSLVYSHPDEDRIAVRTQAGNATASHVDHTLATLAEVGTPLDYPVIAPDRETDVEAILRQALRVFSVNQQEYEWTTLAWALYATDGQPWYSHEGQEVTFDRLARRIMRQDLEQGVCFGNHRLYTLTILLRVDEEQDILSDAARSEVLDHLMDATQRLVATQSVEGWWDSNWPNGKPLDAEQRMDALSRRMLATGHALEWWAMAPAELHPPREVLARAGQWLVRELEQMDQAKIDKTYTFLTHVGRALALWRGDFPADLLRKLPEVNNEHL
ncbi:MAG: hypothetical protein CL681_16345 [Blastopirellula sp.]|nr:hypothetical protein [Blastopirellula sp.]